MRIHPDFPTAIAHARSHLRGLGFPVHTGKWQGIDITTNPAARMHELLNYSFQVPMTGKTLDDFRNEIKPNLPWADLHFEQERVGGYPLNPGETWKIWPWGNSADKHRTSGEQFNHTYAERFWPKYAGATPGGQFYGNPPIPPGIPPRSGIRYRYADLNDVIDTLITDPLTRQAYIPIWFPEDGSHMDRKPCTLGYHVIMRGGYFHMVYYIRSCDIVRHFQDDIYLAVRLAAWILEKLRGRKVDDNPWMKVQLGMFTMHITSLHCFVNDLRTL